jgi:hypothetical protein
LGIAAKVGRTHDSHAVGHDLIGISRSWRRGKDEQDRNDDESRDDY